MKPLKTKAQIRAEIAQQVDSYLAAGGQVEEVERGVSGNFSNANLFSHSTSIEPKQERTPVTEVIQALEARKKTKTGAAKPRLRPKKKLLTDDFGEPVRWVWEE